MAVRAGMETLIERMRGMCALGVEDYTIAGVTYWNDEQIQERLDRTQIQHYNLPTIALLKNENGVWKYYDYQIPSLSGVDFERAGTNSGWAVRDSGGVEVGTANYSVNYDARRITFNTDQAGAGYYLDVRAYTINEVAAGIWDEKAGHVASRVDWKSDNHQVWASQERKNCEEMARRFRMLGGIRAARMNRTDENFG